MNIDIFHETVSNLSQVLNFFFNFHSLRISIINVSILAFCPVLLNEYDDDDVDDCPAWQFVRYNTGVVIVCHLCSVVTTTAIKERVFV